MAYTLNESLWVLHSGFRLSVPTMETPISIQNQRAQRTEAAHGFAERKGLLSLLPGTVEGRYCRGPTHPLWDLGSTPGCNTDRRGMSKGVVRTTLEGKNYQALCAEFGVYAI